MPAPRVLLLRAPGTNCEAETAYAFQLAGAEATTWHVNRLFEQPHLLTNYQILCLPGGFSYGDDIAAGQIFGSQLRQRLTDALAEFREQNKLVLGICNGFQVLIRSGLFEPQGSNAAQTVEPTATLTWNDSGRYEDRWVWLKNTAPESPFLRGIERLYLPVAHAEGRFVARDESTLAKLAEQGQLVLRYDHAEPGHDGLVPYPANPNGSQANVAALSDVTGRILGLMPHPERHLEHWHHPHWTRLPARPHGDGLRIFQNAVGWFE